MVHKRENRRYGTNLPGLLLVEGVNDLNFLCQLFVKRGIYDYNKQENQFIPKSFSSKEKGSYTELKNGLVEELKDESLQAIGIVVDADENLQDRWKDLTKQLQKLEYSDIPNEPNPLGWISETKGKIPLGVWLMPDNTISGILEHFIAWMVPDKNENPLWNHVENSISNVPDRRFANKDLAKAQIATWLAWQKEPGQPISYAIFKKYVDPNSTSADPFIAWVKRLFQL
ncbi:MAG: hypothetical protein DM484_03170 [Candidatus Methylumidiphilus alinenensis]|uniref:DUF4435 domain-containing protein n=1 Tax=Candidatus Methylumidiphilus alinenensis TaxID=2202197 RepID=A0A2W4RRY2_9GAMM|nr:MAG: hypothetical protein DM484_03170 [Candidatus Methylumidiphilus alinenensis]